VSEDADRTDEGEGGSRPQLHMWGGDAEEISLGTLQETDDGPWELVLLVEHAGQELVRGKISFRQADRRLDTAPVIVEETEEEVVERARSMSDSMLRQFLLSVSD